MRSRLCIKSGSWAANDHGSRGLGDLTDELWAVLEPLLPKGARAGRPPVWRRRQLINGIRFRVHRARSPLLSRNSGHALADEAVICLGPAQTGNMQR
ncbi:transposase [Streptomyces sp. HGB0020]|uniref:transposase n=1 Tax=Streptomyces sp. HGB0020 TaxID=1078086 RepID=UPI003B63581B